MQQMKSYTTFLNEKGDLIIVIPFIKGSSPLHPKILYDGKEHALFYRQPNESIILDYLNEVAQVILKQGRKVLMFEVNLTTQDIVNDYFVPVIITEKLPTFDLAEKAPRDNQN